MEIFVVNNLEEYCNFMATTAKPRIVSLLEINMERDN